MPRVPAGDAPRAQLPAAAYRFTLPVRAGARPDVRCDTAGEGAFCRAGAGDSEGLEVSDVPEPGSKSYDIQRARRRKEAQQEGAPEAQSGSQTGPRQAMPSRAKRDRDGS